jgi:hypothetical protein
LRHAENPFFAELLASGPTQLQQAPPSSTPGTSPVASEIDSHSPGTGGPSPVDLLSVRVSSGPWGKKMGLSLDSIFVKWNPETIIALHDFAHKKSKRAAQATPPILPPPSTLSPPLSPRPLSLTSIPSSPQPLRLLKSQRWPA